jgi:hypothetical protein
MLSLLLTPGEVDVCGHLALPFRTFGVDLHPSRAEWRPAPKKLLVGCGGRCFWVIAVHCGHTAGSARA